MNKLAWSALAPLLIAAQQPVRADLGTAPPYPSELSPDVAEIIAEQFILDGKGLDTWGPAVRVQIWNAAAERLRRFGLTVAALPTIRAAYAADNKRLSELTWQQSRDEVDLYVALADNDQQRAARLQADIDRMKAATQTVLNHIKTDTYLRDAAARR